MTEAFAEPRDSAKMNVLAAQQAQVVQAQIQPQVDGQSQASPNRAPAAPDKSWQDYANCLGVDPELFFPERGASTREAKEVCRACVVREECLEYAIANGEKFGIWGGMSERERRRIRRQRALARTATRAND